MRPVGHSAGLDNNGLSDDGVFLGSYCGMHDRSRLAELPASESCARKCGVEYRFLNV